MSGEENQESVASEPKVEEEKVLRNDCYCGGCYVSKEEDEERENLRELGRQLSLKRNEIGVLKVQKRLLKARLLIAKHEFQEKRQKTRDTFTGEDSENVVRVGSVREVLEHIMEASRK